MRARSCPGVCASASRFEQSGSTSACRPCAFLSCIIRPALYYDQGRGADPFYGLLSRPAAERPMRRRCRTAGACDLACVAHWVTALARTSGTGLPVVIAGPSAVEPDEAVYFLLPPQGSPSIHRCIARHWPNRPLLERLGPRTAHRAGWAQIGSATFDAVRGRRVLFAPST